MSKTRNGAKWGWEMKARE